MKREAIIIVTPNYPKEPLPGAEQDAQDWESFLPSVEGGAWKDWEFRVLRDPPLSTVNLWIEHSRKRKPDIAVLAFSGHGEVVKTGYTQETRIFLNPTHYLTERTFTVDADRELVIFDACRVLRVEPSLMKKTAALTANEAVAFSAEDRLAVSRELYDDAIAANPHGRSFVYSCSVNETASDKPSFSQILMGEGESLAYSARVRRTISIRDVFDSSVTVVRNSFKQKQTPVYDGGRRLIHLPFSVSV